MASEISNGGIYSQRVRCGKSSCKCASGEPHTAYYFFTRRGRKLTKFYVRKNEAVAFATIANQSAFERSQKRKSIKLSCDLLRAFRGDLLRNEGMIKGLMAGKANE